MNKMDKIQIEIFTALADINLDNARAFQAEHGGEHIYADYAVKMVKEVKLQNSHHRQRSE